MKRLLYVLFAIIAIVVVSLILWPTKTNAVMGDKTLVAYFSATGNTRGVAEKLSNTIGADLFEIVPEQLYSADDLNWQNDASRSSVEMKDAASRPVVASKIEDMSQYKIVFVGFPIWWGREPSIIDTFMESYDFAGKTVIPFATSGSSDIGNTYENLKKLAPNANVLPGKRFATDVSVEDLKSWADTEIAK